MTYLLTITYIVLGMLTLLPVVWAWQMVFYYARHRGPVPPTPDPLPRAAVLLSVRGADPSLAPCLAGMLDLDYPGYEVRITIDSEEDPAWPIVRAAVERVTRTDLDVRVDVLRERLPTCSLKCSAHLQALASLDDSVEVVAMLDADSIPARDWLRAMVRPFADRAVGAATGIRWFSPPDGGWGTVVRHLYNAGSFTQMYAFDLAWGGSLAIRGDLARDPLLWQIWSHGFCEDNSTTQALYARRLRLAFVPAATQINPETIPLPNCFNFLTRQLLCVRVDHPAWWGIFLGNQGNSLALLVCLALAGWGVATGSWLIAAPALALPAVYAVGMFSALFVGELLIRASARSRGQPTPKSYVGWRIMPALFMAQFICGYLMFRLLRPPPVTWRGITYTIEAPGRLRRGEYTPFRATPPLADSASVI